jgi:hypothetical protein
LNGEGEGRVTSAELPRASRRTNLSRPVARSFTRSTEDAFPAIQVGSVRGGKRRIARRRRPRPVVVDEGLAVAATEGGRKWREHCCETGRGEGEFSDTNIYRSVL